jgi:hypothetical protein
LLSRARSDKSPTAASVLRRQEFQLEPRFKASRGTESSDPSRRALRFCPRNNRPMVRTFHIGSCWRSQKTEEAMRKQAETRIFFHKARLLFYF